MSKETPAPHLVQPEAGFLPKDAWSACLKHALQLFLQLQPNKFVEQAELYAEIKRCISMVDAAVCDEVKQLQVSLQEALKRATEEQPKTESNGEQPSAVN